MLFLGFPTQFCNEQNGIVHFQFYSYSLPLFIEQNMHRTDFVWYLHHKSAPDSVSNGSQMAMVIILKVLFYLIHFEMTNKLQWATCSPHLDPLVYDANCNWVKRFSRSLFCFWSFSSDQFSAYNYLLNRI